MPDDQTDAPGGGGEGRHLLERSATQNSAQGASQGAMQNPEQEEGRGSGEEAQTDEQHPVQRMPTIETPDSPHTETPLHRTTTSSQGRTTPARPTSSSQEDPRGAGLRRSGTLPLGTRSSAKRDPDSPATRRRGATISARPRNLDASPLAQRPGRNGSVEPPASEGEHMDPIPEGGRPRVSGDRGSRRGTESVTSEQARPSYLGLRPRVGTWTSSAPRERSSTAQRRPSVALAATATGRSGGAADTQSQTGFSLAGPVPEVVMPANQPYVDPGYSQLNPAYEQPLNTRPVWGLAKPLPRVIRPGMVPTRSEVQQSQDQRQGRPDADLEQGRIEPTLRVDKISSQLQSTRQNRENQLFQTYSRRGGPGAPSLGRTTSNVPPLSSPSVPENGEDDIGPMPPLDEEHPVSPGGLSPGGRGRLRPSEERWYPDDAASIATAHEEDGYFDDGSDLHAFPLKAYEAEGDEIHNLHTHWSVIRLRFREPLAELLAVTVQLTLGFCSDLAVVTSKGTTGNEGTTDWAWGLATMVGIYIAGGISGAHLNPAISIMLYIYRGFPLRKVPMYVFAQVLGAFLAGLISWGLFQKEIIAYGGTNLGQGGTASAFITFPRRPYIDAGTAFFNEFTGTAILSISVLAMGDDTNAPPGAGMNAFVIGLVVTICSMAFGYTTGAAMNPSRDLGPRLALLAVGYGGSLFYDHHVWWIYGPWAATITGAIFGAFLYDSAIFVGGESPVNYPRKRIRRAGHKWKVKWGHRVDKAKRRVAWKRKGSDDEGMFSSNGISSNGNGNGIMGNGVKDMDTP